MEAMQDLLENRIKKLQAANADLIDELSRALPFLEDMRDDPGYKAYAVATRIASIRKAITNAEALK